MLSILVICTFGYGSAWAYDDHALAINSDELDNIILTSLYLGNQPADQHAGDENSEHASSSDVGCDHCGHISAHIQAIFTKNGYLCNMNQSSELLEFSEDLTTFVVTPDLRPPRV
ncbi:MAG: hypothetical protein JKX75_09120 [Gammaproteobacteria bacterium]|nr:hypothetical protein [Gammaproteobacteria bacterium]